MIDIPLPTPQTVEAMIERIHELEDENLKMAERISALKNLNIELEETNLNNVANYQLQIKDLEQQHKAWKVLESDIVFEQLQKQNAELSATIRAKDEFLIQVKWGEYFSETCIEHELLTKALSLTPPDALKEYLKKTVELFNKLKILYPNSEHIIIMCDKELSRLTGGAK